MGTCVFAAISAMTSIFNAYAVLHKTRVYTALMLLPVATRLEVGPLRENR